MGDLLPVFRADGGESDGAGLDVVVVVVVAASVPVAVAVDDERKDVRTVMVRALLAG
ncbi:hypothetical protein SCHPADRAFT_902945 [Schizopora paradoxa]|uniref:Uncharacterized protein n=1 Tax=Schizopora paradoxa TaxID=27342 RepID=A0A0H2RT62_9AGAM|nr:hypothetical protein SCHPADRAFT_902945 [Schizopora paradoxa]